MKNKKWIVIVIIILILALGAVAGVYLINKKSNDEGTLLEKNDFSVYIPEGWIETNPPAGVNTMIIAAEEDIAGTPAEKINFRTYYSVIYDNLSENSKEDYIATSKKSLVDAIPGLEITEENSETINDRDVYFMEAEFNQRDVNFKSLITIVSGEEDDIWIISFNTMKDNWKKYKDIFYDVSESFELKLTSQ